MFLKKWAFETYIFLQRIQDIHNTFLTNVEMYCKFWDDMDDLDSRVKVIDPIQPSRSHRHRRILLEDNVIIHVIFNPAKPRSLPEISFSGPEKLVEAYNSALDRECKVDVVICIIILL